MKILDKYILRQFVLYIFFSFIAFILLVVVINLIEMIDKFIDRKVPFLIIIKYYLYYIPQIIVLSLPVSMLLGGMFSIGQMTQNNEITAMRASGISLYRIMLPLLIGAFLISIGALYFGETIVPITSRQYLEIRRVYVDRKKPSIRMHRNNIYLRNGRDTRIVISTFDGDKNTAFKVTVQTVYNTTITERYDAAKMVWHDNHWVLQEGTHRVFLNDQDKITSFEEVPRHDFTFIPEDLTKIQYRPEELNYFELKEFVEKLQETGSEVQKWVVELHLKLAYPFANFIIVLFGVPLASNKQRSGAAVGFAISFVICFLYLGFIRFGQVLGYHGILPPAISAWMGNIVFGITGIILIFRVRK